MGSRYFLLNLILFVLFVPNAVFADPCTTLLGSKSYLDEREPAIDGDSRNSNGISKAARRPLNPNGWQRTRKSYGPFRTPTADERKWISEELKRINSVIGKALKVPAHVKIAISEDGEGYYRAEENLIVVPLRTAGTVNLDVLLHEYGHAVFDENVAEHESTTALEVSYEEVFADAMAFIGRETVEEMRREGGAFVQKISAAGWADYEEHQALVPARSALGKLLLDGRTQLDNATRGRFLKETLSALVAEREKFRGSNAAPEMLNRSLIDRVSQIKLP
jgi:hypothetical protein